MECFDNGRELADFEIRPEVWGKSSFIHNLDSFWILGKSQGLEIKVPKIPAESPSHNVRISDII